MVLLLLREEDDSTWEKLCMGRTSGAFSMGSSVYGGEDGPSACLVYCDNIGTVTTLIILYEAQDHIGRRPQSLDISNPEYDIVVDSSISRLSVFEPVQVHGGHER
eukprot:GHVN01064184.1.p2 GENE.GHVN01064184.1~~GHVN01064184.1.p2  ORF type:complete len:105 (-),score=6.08 GHVN01064184.1:638-952(-)